MFSSRHWASALLVAVVGFANALPAAADTTERNLQWPTDGRITQKFGCTGAWTNNRRGRCALFHDGLDIANRAWTPIRAARGGFVTHVGWNRHDPPGQRAWLVIVDHGGGLRTWYAHMQPVVVRGAEEGDFVVAGQLISWMGSTGRSTGNHLHFGVQLNGRFVDPDPYLPADREVAVALSPYGPLAWLSDHPPRHASKALVGTGAVLY